MFKDSSPSQCLCWTMKLRLNFAPLPYICLVSAMICILNCEELICGTLRIVLVFAILTIAPFISESLLGNTPITMVILQKCLGTFSP